MKQLTFISILIISFLSFGQKIEKRLYLKHSFKQDGKAYQFTVRDEDKRTINHFNKNKNYYWFKAQKVMVTQGGASGLLLNGLFESFYPNKQLNEKGQFKNGLKNGEWLYWRNDGTLSKKEFWSGGNKKRKEISYDANGVEELMIKHKWLKTVKSSADSLVTTYNFRDKKKVELLDGMGQVTSSQVFVNGLEKEIKEKVAREKKLKNVFKKDEGEKPESKEGDKVKKESIFKKKDKEQEEKEDSKKKESDKKRKFLFLKKKKE